MPRVNTRRSFPGRLAITIGAAWLAACGARSELLAPGAIGGAGGSGGAGAGGQGGEGGAAETGVDELALGARHSCLRTVAGRVFCWGDNSRGQLGADLPTDEPISTAPVRVDLPGRARTIAAGAYHTCAGLEDRGVYCWGKGTNGQIGDGTFADARTPRRIGTSAPDAVRLALGEEHSCGFLLPDPPIGGEPLLHCWGQNSVGQLGIGSTDDRGTPTQVEGRWQMVGAGSRHTCATSGGHVSCTGSNVDFALGVAGPQSSAGLIPNVVDDVLFLHTGIGNHTCAKTSTRLRCWGDNSSGQLGTGGETEGQLPSDVNGLPPGDTVHAVALSFGHTCALVGRRVFCWGDNFSGQLGRDGIDRSPVPLEVEGIAGVRALGAGTLHTCAFVSPQEVYCWGGNDFGQIGDGTTSTRRAPVRIMLPD